MGFCEALTLIFVILKLIGTIGWSWYWVFAPMVPAVLYYVFIISVVLWSIYKT